MKKILIFLILINFIFKLEAKNEGNIIRLTEVLKEIKKTTLSETQARKNRLYNGAQISKNQIREMFTYLDANMMVPGFSTIGELAKLENEIDNFELRQFIRDLIAENILNEQFSVTPNLINIIADKFKMIYGRFPNNYTSSTPKRRHIPFKEFNPEKTAQLPQPVPLAKSIAHHQDPYTATTQQEQTILSETQARKNRLYKTESITPNVLRYLIFGSEYAINAKNKQQTEQMLNTLNKEPELKQFIQDLIDEKIFISDLTYNLINKLKGIFEKIYGRQPDSKISPVTNFYVSDKTYQAETRLFTNPKKTFQDVYKLILNSSCLNNNSKLKTDIKRQLCENEYLETKLRANKKLTQFVNDLITTDLLKYTITEECLNDLEKIFNNIYE